MRPTKKTLGFFALEFIVIFVGLTASFIFEEWREDRQRHERKVEILRSIQASIPIEKFNIHFADSVQTNQLKIVDSITNGLNVSERSIADFIKVNVRFQNEGTFTNPLADWKSLVNPNDPEMVKIRSLIENDRIAILIEGYLSISESISISESANLKAELSKDMLDDLYRSWKVTNKEFREEGKSTGDMYMGNIRLKGDYKSLLKKEGFIKSVLEIGIGMREAKRTFILLESRVLKNIEEGIKKELGQ